MVNPCSTTATFGAARYFSQHDLPDRTPIHDYTRCFIIYAHSGDTNYLNDLSIGIMPVLEPNDNGTPNTTPWRTKLGELLNHPPMAPSPAFAERPTPIDFYLKKRSCILIRLMGDFWRFPKGDPATAPAPVTTKEDFEGHYYQIGRHLLKGGVASDAGPDDTYRCISFFSNSPCTASPPIKHPISLNVELIVGQHILPITLDPDIENKGGHP